MWYQGDYRARRKAGWILLAGLLGLFSSFIPAQAQDSARELGDWSGFYGGIHVGGAGGVDSSLETQASAQEQRTLAFCEKTPPGNPDNVGVLPNQTKERCSNDPGESPTAASWTPTSCPSGTTLLTTGPNKDQCETPGTDPTYQSSKRECSSGSTLITENGANFNKCAKQDTFAPTYSCNQGTVSGTLCVTNPNPANGKCPGGFTLNGTRCEKPATASCSEGSLSGNSCVATTYSDSTLTCPSGTVLKTTGNHKDECETPGVEPKYAASTPGYCTVNGQSDNAPNEQACTAKNNPGRQAENRQWRELAFIEKALAKHRVSDDGDINFFGGIHGGYALQRGRWVIGAEADINAITQGREFLSSTSTASVDADVAALNFINNFQGNPDFQNPAVARDLPQFQAGSPTTITTSASGDFGVTDFGTVRGRLGMALGERWLPFITGGLAYGQVSTEGSVTYSGVLDDGAGGQPFNVTRSFGENEFEFGWTAGGGVNYKLAKSVSIGVSYLYIDLGKHSISDSFSKTINWNGGDPSVGDFSAVQGGVNGEVDARFHSARFTLTYFLN
jgi:opacity protein-like surface antigen